LVLVRFIREGFLPLFILLEASVMIRRMLLVLLAIGFLAGVLANSSCCPGGPESVLLQGAVTIGPISPVEKPGECPPVPPEVFSARKIVIYDESGERLVREVAITQIGNGATGYYTAQIAPGTYIVDINHLGVDRADNLPQKITVIEDETVTIDVNIDTSIR
jgi:hypothetical protein